MEELCYFYRGAPLEVGSLALENMHIHTQEHTIPSAFYYVMRHQRERGQVLVLALQGTGRSPFQRVCPDVPSLSGGHVLRGHHEIPVCIVVEHVEEHTRR